MPRSPSDPVLTKQQAIARLRSLVAETWSAHRDPDHSEYNECDDAECLWCEDTRKALQVLESPDEPTRDAGCPHCREVYEIWANTEGFQPVTAPEGYQQRIIEQMRVAAEKGLHQDRQRQSTRELEAEPKAPRTLVQAKAEAERVFDEWNDVTGMFQSGVSYDAEIRSVIDDAVTIGWNGGVAEGPEPRADEPLIWECDRCKALSHVMLTSCYSCGEPRQVNRGEKHGG